MYPKDENNIYKLNSYKYSCTNRGKKSRRERRTFMPRAYDMAPNNDVILSWGTQRPKSDKKENITQL
jgi:hypothetical protein